MAQLTDGVQYLKGIGPAKAKLFEALGIRTIGDLLYHYPRTYEDRTKLVPIASLEVGQPACFRAMVMTSPRTSLIRKGLELTKVTVADHSARLNITFFNQKHTAERLEYGKEYIFYGAVSGDFIGYNMTNPVFETPEEKPLVTRRILPVYPLTAGLTNKAVSKAVLQALESCGTPPEILPQEVRTQYGILPADKAYRAIHQPQDAEELDGARRRLVFEEFFVFSAGLSLMRARRTVQQVGAYENLELEPFCAGLPFSLTGAQRRAMEEIAGDLRRGVPMNRLLQGGSVELPHFNFKKGIREYNGDTLALGPQDILVIEGIHCLNDGFSHALPQKSKFKIYISALTQLNIDEHNRIPSTDGRLLRRIVRDARTRGTSAQETIAMWPSVRRGEEENIFPYQDSADTVFNSALIYETALLKTYVQPLLFGVPRGSEEYLEAKRLLKFLDYFLPIPADDVPKTSLLREFVGGGCFKI